MEETQVPEKKITLNGKELSEAEFQVEKKRLTEQKVKLVPVSETEYRTRLID